MHNDIIDRTLAEEKLRKALQAAQASNAQYEQAVSMISDIIWRYEVNTKRKHVGSYISPVADRMLGLPEGTIGDSFEKYFSYIHPDDLQAMPETLFKAIRTLGKDKTVEYRIRKADGTTLWVHSKFSTYSQPDGRITVFGITSDITERKQSDESQRATNQIIDGIINTIPIRVFWKDRDLIFLGCNAIFAHDAGFADSKDIIGKDDYQMVWRDQAELYQEDDRQVIESGRSKLLIEESQTTPEGNIINLLTSKIPLRNSVGEIIGILGTYMDITERKQAEQALREVEARSRRMVETANEGIMIMNDQFRYVFVNQKLADMLGYQPEEMIGQPVTAFIFDEDLPDHRAKMEMRVSGAGAQYERRHRHKDGSSCWTIVSATPLKDESSQFAGSFAMLTDITARKRAEEELCQTNQALEFAIKQSNEMAEQAKKANAAKSEFLANMSHEIRTPLNGIIGMIGLLMDMDLNQEQHEYAVIAHKSSEILLSLINDILDFSKIEALKLELETLDFDLRPILDDTTDLLAIGAHEKGLELVCMVHPTVPLLLRGDPGRLRQLLVNLGSNAVKFTKIGKISIRASLENEDERNATIRFSVSDTGIGIPATRQKILFSPFVQVDNSTTRRYGGTGLGLAISKQLAELMGGRIGVESEEGKGSTFWFTAMFEKQPIISGSIDEKVAKFEGKGAIERSVAEPTFSEKGKHKILILVAEDNHVNQKVAQAMLRKMGLRADVVADGQEAVNALKSIPYDLVLMDCQMPEMDGFEATRLIRQHESKVLNPRIPIIAMTAATMQGDREKCIQAGMSDFIAKPVQKRELTEMLARWLTTTVSYNPNTKAI
jgi:PAS domain S-box-containing protein